MACSLIEVHQRTMMHGSPSITQDGAGMISCHTSKRYATCRWSIVYLLTVSQSETFTPPPPAQAAEFDISHIPAAHGTTGPVKASYPPFIYPHIKSFIQALKNVGVPWSIDQAANAIGVFMVPNSINPTTVTRSYAANEYYAPVSTRTNLHLITEKRVTKLLSSLTATGKLKITGVEVRLFQSPNFELCLLKQLCSLQRRQKVRVQ